MSSEKEMELEENEKKFHCVKKGYFLTYSQCPLDKKDVGEFLVSLGPEIVVVAQEHHKDKGLHLHAWCEWPNKKNVRNPRYFDFRGYHGAIGSTKNKECNTRANALKYILKEDTAPYAYGIDLDAWKGAKKNHRAFVGELLISGKKTVQEIVKEYPQEIYNIDKLQRNLNLFKVLSREVPQYIQRKCYWIVGESGVGKSYGVRSMYDSEELFIKTLNKWWDGYAGEEAVLLDDFGPEHSVLSYYLKIWADNYRFNGEIKGGMIAPYYKTMYVTSNYLPEDIWKVDPDKLEDPNEELLKAINRRFEIRRFNLREDQFEFVADVLNLDYVYVIKLDLKLYKN